MRKKILASEEAKQAKSVRTAQTVIATEMDDDILLDYMSDTGVSGVMNEIMDLWGQLPGGLDTPDNPDFMSFYRAITTFRDQLKSAVSRNVQSCNVTASGESTEGLRGMIAQALEPYGADEDEGAIDEMEGTIKRLVKKNGYTVDDISSVDYDEDEDRWLGLNMKDGESIEKTFSW